MMMYRFLRGLAVVLVLVAVAAADGDGDEQRGGYFSLISADSASTDRLVADKATDAKSRTKVYIL